MRWSGCSRSRGNTRRRKVGGSSGGVPPLLRAAARPPSRVQSQARRQSTAAACASARSSRFGGRGQGCWRVEPWCTWLHCCLTPRSRGDPTRRATLGPRRAVAGSIVLRGPRVARLAGRLSSNVRPHLAPSVAYQGSSIRGWDASVALRMRSKVRMTMALRACPVAPPHRMRANPIHRVEYSLPLSGFSRGMSGSLLVRQQSRPRTVRQPFWLSDSYVTQLQIERKLYHVRPHEFVSVASSSIRCLGEKNGEVEKKTEDREDEDRRSEGRRARGSKAPRSEGRGLKTQERKTEMAAEETGTETRG
jgi:hypothetical protein